MPSKILVISGPTASGKTRMGVELCQIFNGEVVSADSMQIYRGMDIGTAKPSKEEMGGIIHHMMDVAEPEEDYSVARYVREASAVIDEILSRGKLPVVVGGTGLYIDSLVSGRSFAVKSTGWRERLQEKAREVGMEAMMEELRGIDPEAAARLHPNDEKRVIRALEVWYESGKTITQHNRETMALPPRYEAVTVSLNFADRKDLWARIDRRVDVMMEQGLVEEVQRLLDRGVPRTCTAMQAIGYKEMAAALDVGGDVEAAAREIMLRSRQYAKRQLTWFRKNAAAHWILWDSHPDFEAGRRKAAEFVKASGL